MAPALSDERLVQPSKYAGPPSNHRTDVMDRVLESDRDRRAVGGFARIRPSKLANAVNARLFVDVSLESVPIEVIDGQALSILGLRPPPAIEQVP
jgi:hypothetical protein